MSFLIARNITLSASRRLHIPRRFAQCSTSARNIPHPESNVIGDGDDGDGDISLSGGVSGSALLLLPAERFSRPCRTI